ncbi:hypothetical protein ATN88_07580 [Enterovibrio coralii]|uniref:Uncharacterized protein n=1 Tax=Enterovibrio coralii TaxID=294935 RepID=A0A135I532_9GAMM|nr:hypothetical protein ATN88_07580 [Enterovibrio coralii]
MLMANRLGRRVLSLTLVDMTMDTSNYSADYLKSQLGGILDQTEFNQQEVTLLTSKFKYLSERSFRWLGEKHTWNLNPHIGLRWLRDVGNRNMWRRWNAIKVPKLVLHSANSGYIKRSALLRYRLSAHVVTLKGGHALHQISPAKVAKLYKHFISTSQKQFHQGKPSWKVQRM